MAYAVQLLPDYNQARVLVEALKMYSHKAECEGEEEKQYLADELRLDILRKLREARQ